MEEKKFVDVRKDEYNIKQYVMRLFGKGKVSKVRIEYTPVGEKIVVSTHKPGLIIGRKGEKISDLTDVLKKRFRMENPHIEIEEIKNPNFDAQIIADEIALSLEKFGSMKYKAVAYKILTRIKESGALGAEIRTTGKLPSDRARSWRFSFGYLKKTGDASSIVDKAESVAETKQGVIGIKVSILPPGQKIIDQIVVNEEVINNIKKNSSCVNNPALEEQPKSAKKISKKGATK